MDSDFLASARVIGSPVLQDEPNEQKRGEPHLAYLDGIRGLSALYVVLFHAALGRKEFPYILRWTTAWIEYGRSAVAVFIVLSGYCLMLPIARSVDKTLRGGAKEYLKRRARRILPPYYAALTLAALIVGIGRLLKHQNNPLLTPDPLALTSGNLVTHVLLIHNLYPFYVMTLNYALWSVALEWQLYFMLPLLLLPLWRRLGITAMMVIACLLGLAPLLLPRNYDLRWTSPWYLGLFAMGMSAAVLTDSRDETYRAVFRKTPWLLLTILFCAALIPIPRLNNQRFWYCDLLVGLASACVILHCRHRLQNRTRASRGLLLRVFESRFALRLGLFSYSLYLVHIPLGWFFDPLYRVMHLSGLALFLFSICIKIPLFCAVAFGFHRIFEQPYTAKQRQSRSY